MTTQTIRVDDLPEKTTAPISGDVFIIQDSEDEDRIKKIDATIFEWPTWASATIEAGSTTTTVPWTPATVTNVGTTSDAIFNFTIPKGEPWEGENVLIQSTSQLTWWIVTSTMWSTTFNITAWTWQIIDWETKTIISWDDGLNIPIVNIWTQAATIIWIDSEWNIIQDTLPVSKEWYRDKVYLKLLIHNTGVVTGIQDAFLTLDKNVASQVTDLALALWPINLAWNWLWPNGNNMKLDKVLGSAYASLSNYSNNPKNPSTVDFPAQVEATFLTTWKDWVGWYILSNPLTDLISWRYDDWTWWTIIPNWTLASSKYMNYHCFMTITWLIVLQYGEKVYDNEWDAVVWAESEAFEKNPILAGTLDLGRISLRWNTTNLSVITDAIFTKGKGISGWGSSGAIFTRQATYDVSTTPQTKTSSNKWADTWRNGEGDDSTDTMRWENNAWEIVAKVRGDWIPTTPKDLITKEYGDENYGKIDSVFWRTGIIVAQNNDYTKAQVWLSNVDNTSDADKPVSTAQQTALDSKDFIRTMWQIASNLSFWTWTQAEFDALTPNATTFYIITT